jgi:hypothetical protein
LLSLRSRNGVLGSRTNNGEKKGFRTKLLNTSEVAVPFDCLHGCDERSEELT